MRIRPAIDGPPPRSGPDRPGIPADVALRARHPKVCLWYGRFTGRWWAIIGDRLIEASSARELDALIGSPQPVEGPGGSLIRGRGMPGDVLVSAGATR